MQEEQFKEWLKKQYGNNNRTVNLRIANCLRVEQFEGDLNNHYANDKCKELLHKLTYSTNDEEKELNPKHNIPIDGNIRNGTATLKQAISLYIQYKQGNSILRKNRTKKQEEITKIDWPEWNLPSENEILILAKIATKYIRFLNPDIIALVTENNLKHFNHWTELLIKQGIKPELYLWDGSPCCFPGVRRYAGSKERAYYKKHIEIENDKIDNAIILDENDFPKQIWSFLFRKKQFSKYGPNNYSLAHLIDHKKSKNRMKDELIFNNSIYQEPYYGLYTCPSNTIYIPDMLLKPTDFNLKFRKLLFQKAEDLYKNVCNIVPKNITIPDSDNNWNINNFEWGDCVGTIDNIEIFLDFRLKKMNELLNNSVRMNNT